MRVAGFARSASSALSSKPGACRTSKNCSASRSPSSRPTGRLRTTTPPYAERGSDASARSYASSIVAATATPHGFPCLTMTQQARVNSAAQARAAERSPRLLKDRSLPCSCSARERRWRRAPVRVLAVGEVLHLREDRDEALRERLAVGEPARDRRFVRRGGGEGLGGQRPPRLERQAARLAQLAQDSPVLVRPGHGRYVGEVLRRPPEHRRAADVDHLHGFVLANAVLRRHLREGVEVHTHEVEGLDLLLIERGEIVGAVAAGEDRRVDARVEGLDAAAEELGHLGELVDARRPEPELLEIRRGAAARDELGAERLEPACELLQIGLVVDRDQRAHSSRTTSGSTRCSIALIRSCSVSAVSPARTATRSWRRIGPESTPSSTRWTVAPDSATPAASCSSTARAPGKAGSSEGWTFTIRSGNRSRKDRVRRCMYPARTTSSTPLAPSHSAIAPSRAGRSG